MEDEIKYWILFYLNKTPNISIDINKLISDKPTEIEFDYAKLLGCLTKLSSSNLIEEDQKEFTLSFKIKEKGILEIKNFLKQKDFDYKKFYNIIRKIPEIELRDRIQNLENFAFWGVLLIASFLSIDNPNVTYNNIYIISLILILFLVSFIKGAGYFITISYLSLEKFQTEFSNKIIGIFQRNKTSFTYLGYIVLLISGIIFLNLVLKISYQSIFQSIGIGLVVALIIYIIKKIQSHIKEKKNNE